MISLIDCTSKHELKPWLSDLTATSVTQLLAILLCDPYVMQTCLGAAAVLLPDSLSICLSIGSSHHKAAWPMAMVEQTRHDQRLRRQRSVTTMMDDRARHSPSASANDVKSFGENSCNYLIQLTNKFKILAGAIAAIKATLLAAPTTTAKLAGNKL